MVEATAAAGGKRSKLYPDAATALRDLVRDGQTLAVGASACAAFPRR